MSRGLEVLKRAAQAAVAAPVRAAQTVASTARAVSNSAGAAPLHAEFRRGLKDLQDAVLQAFPQSKLSRDEPNTIANPTQYTSTQERLGRPLTEGVQNHTRRHVASM
jgi:hypothetical protein